MPGAGAGGDTRPVRTPFLGALRDQRAFDGWKRFWYRWFTSAGNKVKYPVPLGAVSVTVPWPRREANDNYGVICTPNWATIFAVTVRDEVSCTLDFVTAAPSGASVDVITFRSED